MPSTYTHSFSGSGTQFATNSSVSSFLGGTFDASASFGSIEHVPFLGRNGATANMDISGRAGLNLNFTGVGGTVAAAHTSTLNLNFTQPNRFGEQVTFSPGNSFARHTNGSFTTESPSFGYGASLDMGLEGTIGGSFYVLGSGGSGSFSFDGDVNLPLFSMNENNSGVVNLLGLPIVGASPGLGLSATMQRLVGAAENYILSRGLYYGLSEKPPMRLKLNLSTPADLRFVQELQLQLGLPKQLGPYDVPKSAQNIDRVSAGVTLGTLTEQAPVISLTSNQSQSSGVMTATGRSDVARLSIQTGPIAAYLLGQPALAAATSKVSVNLGPFSASFTPVSFEIQPTLYASHTVTVEPVNRLTYTFTERAASRWG